MRGDFKERPFPELLAELEKLKATGALLLRREKVKKIAYFREGMIQSIKGNLLSECLGRVMVKERLISESEYDESLRRMMSGGKRQGAVLVEMGCISPHNLSYALQLQIRSKLFEIFSWESGDYQFNEGAQFSGDSVSIEMSSLAMIYEGTRRGFSDQRLRKFSGEVDRLFVYLPAGPVGQEHRLGLEDEERQFLDAIDGLKNVADLKRLALLSEGDTERMAYALKCLQIGQLVEEPVSANSRFDLH